MGKMGVLAAMVLLGAGQGHAGQEVDYPGKRADRSRSGERLLGHEVERMQDGVVVFTTVEAQALPIPQVSVLGRVFRVRPASIRKFRWGRSLAPAGHRLENSLWYTIWYEGEEGLPGRQNATLRVDEGDKIIEKVEW